MKKEIKTPVLLLGDLNMMPNDEILRPLFDVIKDVANGKNEPATWPVDEDKFVGEYEATIKNITEQEKSVTLFLFEFFNKHSAVICRAVNI